MSVLRGLVRGLVAARAIGTRIRALVQGNGERAKVGTGLGKRGARAVTVLALLVVLLLPSHVRAQVEWTWTVTNPFQTIGPEDTATFFGRITNDPAASSAADLGEIFGFAGSFFVGGGVLTYSITLGPDPSDSLSFTQQFDGVILNSGESFDFVLLIAHPISPPVSPGIYSATFPILTGPGFAVTADTNMRITVVGLSADVLFGLSSKQDLYTIDLDTGAATFIGGLGFIENAAISLAASPVNGDVITFDRATDEFFEIDRTNVSGGDKLCH